MVANRAAELRALRDDLERRIREQGVGVLQQSWTDALGTVAQYEPQNALIWYASDVPLEVQALALLHESVHAMRNITGEDYVRYQRREELLAEGAAALALFQLAGVCGFANRTAAKYMFQWRHRIFDVPRGAADTTTDAADRVAGQVLEWLGFAETAEKPEVTA